MICVDFINGEEQVIASEHLYQWDVNRSLQIRLEDSVVNNIDDIMVHFANKYSEQALVVAPFAKIHSSESNIQNCHLIGVEIPNSLLESASPIIAYVHDTIGEEQKTIRMATILIEPRKKPNDYISEQDHIYTLETLRAEVRSWFDEMDAEREADYQNFKNQIKQDVRNTIVEQTKPDVTEYEYLSNTKIKLNGVTYTVTKDTTTGLIKSISSSNGDTINATLNSGITDVTLHNAVFWATAISAYTKNITLTGMTIIPNVVESTVIIGGTT